MNPNPPPKQPPSPAITPAPQWGYPAALILFAATWLLPYVAPKLIPLWPSAVALLGVLLSRRILLSLLLGACAGAILLNDGNPWRGLEFIVSGPTADIIHSSWKLAALSFTLLLGGMAGLIERGGGMRSILRFLTRNRPDSPQRVQWAAYIMGFVCFFDGLANSMIVGRMSRAAADGAGLSRARLAYLVDSTGSAVACVALLSTWIAFQLSMIQEGYRLAGETVHAYGLFLHSIPVNFYCLFTLLLAALSIRYHLLFRSMAAFEQNARVAFPATDAQPPLQPESGGPAIGAWLPLLILILSLPIGLFMSGADFSQPLDRQSIALAFGRADAASVLVVCSLLASAVAFFSQFQLSWRERLQAYVTGCAALGTPVLVLLAAWILGGSLNALGSGEMLAGFLQTHVAFWLLPTAVFITGAMISFTTGTSWGTMALLMPLAITTGLSMSFPQGLDSQAAMALIVAAVFSGAVFGDHCSPLSDTTLVSSLSCGIGPVDHVRTQMPYALLAAAIAIFSGFLPAAAGVPYWVCLMAGGTALLIIARLGPRGIPPQTGTGPTPGARQA